MGHVPDNKLIGLDWITILIWFVTVKWRLLIALKFLLHSRHLANI